MAVVYRKSLGDRATPTPPSELVLVGGNFGLFWLIFLIVGTLTTLITYFLATSAETTWLGVHIKR